jgi:hypothetical protein
MAKFQPQLQEQILRELTPQTFKYLKLTALRQNPLQILELLAALL